MATKDSKELETNERYPLGDYSFRIERSSVPGSTNDKIEAICTDKDGKNARKSIQVPSNTQLGGWYVEANETEATVYALVKTPKGGEGKKTSDLVPIDVPVVGSVTIVDGNRNYVISGPSCTAYKKDYNGHAIIASETQTTATVVFTWDTHTETTTIPVNNTFTHNGKTVYLTTFQTTGTPTPNVTALADYNDDAIAWTMIYGSSVSPTEYDIEEKIVGRFAIELEDAGGVGPESDWTDPGDYDEDWEEGDPTHTLYVTVTGALSGRHNDPIEDPSYSYIPADKDTVKDYGCGGDGGHGGGGGAGASTVVIHKFATNQANSKEVTAIAKRHGYGSGGGKGGKGGDGCILVYY